MEENSTNTTQDTSTQEPVEGIRIFADLPVKATLSGDEKIIIGDDIFSSESEEETSQTNLAQTDLNNVSKFVIQNTPYVGENIIPCSPIFYELGSYNIVDGSGTPVAGGPYMRTTDYWPAKPGKYIASISDNFAHCGLTVYNIDKAVIATVAIKTLEWVNKTFELPVNTAYVRFSGRMEPYNESSQPGDILNARIKIEPGTIATPWCPNANDIVLKPDYTILSEQIVPGEFWLGEDGTSRQVYCRTFKGTLSSDETYTAITGGIWNAQIVQGYINENNQYNMPFNLIHATSVEAELNYLATMYVNRVSKILIISYSPNSLAKGADYVLTVKYTKA